MSEVDRAKWDARYAREGASPREPSPFVTSLEDRLPRQGRALDLAGGTGRHALWLSRRGLDTTVADISPVALALAGARARSEGLLLRTLAIDLEEERVPEGPWGLILCVDFLWRPLFDAIPRALAPGGLLVVAHPTVVNLERHERPSRSYLLLEGELPRLIPDLAILHHEEAWTPEGRHEARLLARRR